MSSEIDNVSDSYMSHLKEYARIDTQNPRRPYLQVGADGCLVVSRDG